MSFNLKHKKKQALLLLVLIGILCSFVFIEWWILKVISYPTLSPVLILVLFYLFTQIYFLWIIYLHVDYPKNYGRSNGFKIDLFLPTYNEPVNLVEKVIKAAAHLNCSPTIYLIDDGNKAEYKNLAAKYNINYLSRSNPTDNKAGNINNVLKYSEGELVAVFDIDHVPDKNFLEQTIGYFKNPQIGVVQVALDHYNCQESFVAKASSIMSDDFFATTMLGMNEMGCAVVFGSNSIFRREALLSINGYQRGLAEDLHTSIKLHAKKWKSIYVPEILAKGLVPADLKAFFKQQFKWACGVFEVLFRKYPGLIGSLSLKQNICYLTRMTYYLAGPIFFLHIVLASFALFSKDFSLDFADYVLNALPLVLMFIAVQIYIKQFYFIKKMKKGFHLKGYMLVLGTWAQYTAAFVSALFNIKIPFISTPKEVTESGSVILIIPQIAATAVLASGIVYSLFNYNNLSRLITIIFASLLIIIHYAVFYAAYENYKLRKKVKREKDHRQLELTPVSK